MNKQLESELIKNGVAPAFAKSLADLSVDWEGLESLLYMFVDESDPLEKEATMKDIKELYKDIVTSK